MYGFLRRPKWIALTIGVVALMVAMVNLGFWQLRRLDTRRATNTAVREMSKRPVVPLTDVLPAGATFASATTVEWRNVTVTGTFDVAHQVLVANRSLDGLPGDHVVTPLQLADGTAVLINRGWVPVATTVGALPAAPEPAPGTVTITGRVRRTQTRGVIGPRDPATGTLAVVKRVDVARIAKQTPYPLLPAYVELTTNAPPGDATLPRPLPMPELSEGPHLSYAVQWFVFTACAAAGWLAVVRRQVSADRKAARRASVAGEPDSPEMAPAKPAESEQSAARGGP